MLKLPFHYPKTGIGLFPILGSASAGLRLTPRLRAHHLPKLLESITRKDLLLFGVFAFIFAFGLTVKPSNNEASGQPAYGGEYVEGIVGQPRFINPVLSPANSVDTDLSRIVYAQLLKFDKDLQLVADLAEALPIVSTDQKVYTLKLKPNLKWQDGKPILADDVVFTIQTIQNGDFESPLRGNFSRVKAEKIDDLTVAFTLREVSASFITNFTLGILPRHVWEGLAPSNFHLTDQNLKPVGSGPFVVREIKKTADGTIKSMTLRANEGYHEGRPYIDRITFKFYPEYESLINAYQAKEIQGLGYLPFDKKAFFEASDKYNQYKISLPQYQAVFFNLPKNPVLADKAVRQGLWLATNRKTIIDEVYFGFAQEAYGPVLQGNLGFNPKVKEMTHTDLNEAAAILDKGGWVFDPAAGVRIKNKKPLEFNLATNNFVLNVKTAQILQNQWQQIGAIVHLVIVSPSELEQQYIRGRNFDALLFSENTGADPDPFAFWHSSQARDPGLNVSGFSNGEVDKLLTAARQTNDVNVRATDYQQFQMIVADAIPAVFLDSAVFAYNVPKKIQGMQFSTIIHPAERFLDVHKWYIETR